MGKRWEFEEEMEEFEEERTERQVERSGMPGGCGECGKGKGKAGGESGMEVHDGEEESLEGTESLPLEV